MSRRLSLLLLVAVALFTQSTVLGTELAGKSGQASGPNWQSAYTDLDTVRDFKKGDRIVIRVEGSAEWVKVRLLPQNGNPDQPTGLIGDKIKVPAGGKLEIILREDRLRIKQISVHAGKEAWGEVINPKGGKIKILRIDINP